VFSESRSIEHDAENDAGHPDMNLSFPVNHGLAMQPKATSGERIVNSTTTIELRSFQALPSS